MIVKPDLRCDLGQRHAGAQQVAGCAIDRVRVLGLADAQGGATANLNLSERRAQSVTAALEAQGLPAPVFEVQAAGASGATTADGANAPMRRRTEVLIEVVASAVNRADLLQRQGHYPPPPGASEILGLFIYRLGFTNFDFAGSSAVSTVLIGIAVLCFIFYVPASTRKRHHTEGRS